VRIERYWQPSTTLVTRSEADTLRALDELLRESCPRTLSDVPVGVFLSGGMDRPSPRTISRSARTAWDSTRATAPTRCARGAART